MTTTVSLTDTYTDKTAGRTATLLAILDSVAPLGYLLMSDAQPVQIAALAVKFFLLLTANRPLTIGKAESAFLLIVAIFFVQGTAVDMISGIFDDNNELRYIAFLLSFASTTSLLDARYFTRYCAILGLICTGFALLHLTLSFVGVVSNRYGRYFYLGNTHPNLGGEISAVAAIAIGILPLTLLRLGSLVALLSSSLIMQSRSAVVVIACILALHLAMAAWSRFGTAGRAFAFVACVSGIAYMILDPSGLEHVFSQVLLLDDSRRGLGSGFVGRDERWALALSAFSDDPIFGKGLSAVDTTGGLGFHNGIMYGLALHGIFSLALWGVLFRQMLRAFRYSKADGLVLASGLFLVMFNDRFINLNLYPFGFYLMVLKYPLSPHKQNTNTGEST